MIIQILSIAYLTNLLAMVHAVLAARDTDTCLHLGGVWPALCKFDKT